MSTPIPALSVLVPCFNAARTINQAIESLLSQTWGDFEVILVDDGSTDDTSGLLANWEKRDGRLRVVSQAHQGIVRALNHGLVHCRAPLVARLDADDRSHPQRFEYQVRYMDLHPDVSLLGCRVAAFPDKEVREGFRVYLDWQNALLADEDIRREIFIESPLAHPSVLFRKNVVEEAGNYQEKGWPEDYDLWLRLYLTGARFAKLPKVLVEWRESPDRLTRTDSRYSVENFLRAKAHYLARGPLLGRDAVIIWGAGMMGRRLSKHIVRQGVPLVSFIDIDPKKIGHTRRGLPIHSPDALPDEWGAYQNPALLVAVGARGARRLIREYLKLRHLQEGVDWWFTA